MTERNYGIDFLRIISMVMVVTLHVLLHGGILDNTVRFSFNYEFAWFLETASFCAVNCYALISGYVGVDSKFKYSGIIYLWLQVAFYRVLITGIFWIFIPGTAGVLDFIKSFFPILFAQHWYFTAYFGMFFLIPYYNCLIKAMSQKQFRQLLFVIIVLFSVLPTIRRVDYFGTSQGYSLLWLSLLYIIGGYIKKYINSEKVIHFHPLLLYFVCVFFTWLSKLAIEWFSDVLLNRYQKGVILISYTSPTILLASIALVIYFSTLKMSSVLQKAVSILSPLSFGVYLIHMNHFIRDYFLNGAFLSFSQLSPVKFIFSIFFSVIGIYITCSLADAVRLFLFEKLDIKNKLYTLELCIMQNYFR